MTDKQTQFQALTLEQKVDELFAMLNHANDESQRIFNLIEKDVLDLRACATNHMDTLSAWKPGLQQLERRLKALEKLVFPKPEEAA